MSRIKAAIIDLDGVITQTATMHAEAWKRMFDAYNNRREKQGKPFYQPFSIDEDYLQHLDGMPRYKGVNNFLISRGIELPWGDEGDEPGKETVCGLGNWKNQMFQQVLSEGNVKIFEPNVSKIMEWKEAGIHLAVISSSKNCKKILEVTRLEDLFEVRVDGIVSRERNLKGKPDPDIFLEAARELNVDPSEALIVEDSRAGVEAGKKGGFQRVIGIANKEQEKIMREHGASEVVENLEHVNLNGSIKSNIRNLPSGLENFRQILIKIKDHSVILCLDYDGTLTPIVNDYNKAVISDEMREQIKKVAEKLPVAIISGRDIQFIKDKINLEGIFYAGSHGFEIEGPNNFHHELKEAEDVLHIFEQVEKELKNELRHIEGVQIERKKYAIAVHYRNVAEEVVPEVKAIVDRLLSKHKKLVKGRGKKVIELKPDIKWNKGKAVEMISGQLNDMSDVGAVIYVGDDVTDEDAFQSIENGVGILIGSHDEHTAADYRLNDVKEVRVFLQKLLESL